MRDSVRDCAKWARRNARRPRARRPRPPGWVGGWWCSGPRYFLYIFYALIHVGRVPESSVKIDARKFHFVRKQEPNSNLSDMPYH